jgi:hypothetical protein
MHQRSRRPRRLSVEVLEARRLLSGTPPLIFAVPPAPAPPTLTARVVPPAPTGTTAGHPNATPARHGGTAPADPGTPPADTAPPVNSSNSGTGVGGNPATAPPANTGTAPGANLVPVDDSGTSGPGLVADIVPVANVTLAGTNAGTVTVSADLGSNTNVLPVDAVTDAGDPGPGDVGQANNLPVAPVLVILPNAGDGSVLPADNPMTAAPAAPAPIPPCTGFVNGREPLAPAPHRTTRHDDRSDLVFDLGPDEDAPALKSAVAAPTDRADDPFPHELAWAGPDERHARPAPAIDGGGGGDDTRTAGPNDGFLLAGPDGGLWARTWLLAGAGTGSPETAPQGEADAADFVPHAAGPSWGPGVADVSLLEQGLQQFLSQLGAASARMAGPRALLGLSSCLIAVAAAATAMEVGRRQLNRARGRLAWATGDEDAWSWFSTFGRRPWDDGMTG